MNSSRQRRAFIDGALTSCSCIKLILDAINTHGQGKVMERPMFLTWLPLASEGPGQTLPGFAL